MLNQIDHPQLGSPVVELLVYNQGAWVQSSAPPNFFGIQQHVPLYLLDMFRKEEKPLRTIARDLTAHNPKQRTSLLEWRSYLFPPFLDISNGWDIDERNASRTRQDSMGVDGENTKPPDAKKQRLNGLDQNGIAP